MQNLLSTTIAKGTADVSIANDATGAVSSDTPTSEIFEKNLEQNKVEIFKEVPKNTVDESSAKKRGLPEHVKEHFEANSSAFVAFAKEKETKKGINLDAWEKALLFEEYPDGRIPVEVAIKRRSGIARSQKTVGTDWRYPSECLVITDTPKIPQIVKKEPEIVPPVAHPTTPPIATPIVPTFTPIAIKEIPKKIEPVQIRLPRYIPKKPVIHDMSEAQPIVVKEEPEKMPVFEKPIEVKVIEKTPKTDEMIAGIPKKPDIAPAPEATPSLPEGNLPTSQAVESNKKERSATLPLVSVPNMGDALKEKIIERQIRDIFGDAPEGVKSFMEKLPAKEILSPGSFANDKNETWKTLLREYVVKLKWQGKTVFGSPENTDPKEDETILDYIKRIYPAIVRAEVNEDNKKS